MGNVSVSANKALYEKIRRCNPRMCEALRELMKDEIESEIEEKTRNVRQEERRETIKNLMDSMKWTAEQAMEAMKVPVKDREQYMAGL
jgi:hypothetical protein